MDEIANNRKILIPHVDIYNFKKCNHVLYMDSPVSENILQNELWILYDCGHTIYFVLTSDSCLSSSHSCILHPLVKQLDIRTTSTCI